MRYAFDDSGAAERHVTQYFEMFCNRGIYHEGWTAVTRHSTLWIQGLPLPPFADDTWELYDTNTDWSQAHDLAAQMPDKLDELGWCPCARRARTTSCRSRPPHRALQLRPRRTPDAGQGQFATAVRRHGTADRERRHQRQEQVARGDRRSDRRGWRRRRRDRRPGRRVRRLERLLKDGWPTYAYNLLGVRHFDIASATPVPPGSHQVRMEFTYDGGGLGKGGDVALYLDGTKTGEGRLDATVPLAFSGDETCDLGSDTASPVSDQYTPEGSRFTGTVEWVQIDIADAADDLDHLISPEEWSRSPWRARSRSQRTNSTAPLALLRLARSP